MRKVQNLHSQKLQKIKEKYNLTAEQVGDIFLIRERIIKTQKEDKLIYEFRTKNNSLFRSSRNGGQATTVNY